MCDRLSNAEASIAPDTNIGQIVPFLIFPGHPLLDSGIPLVSLIYIEGIISGDGKVVMGNIVLNASTS